MSDKKIDKLMKSAICNASSIVDRDYPVISISPIIDDIAGGGIKTGTTTIITGIYKGGKTATVLHIAKKFQEKGYLVFYHNIEHRLTERDLKTHHGLDLDPDKLKLVMSTKGSILSGEDHLRILRHNIETHENSLHIVDSFSAMCSDELFEGDVGDRFRDPMPNKISNLCKLITSSLGINNNTLIGITHEIANQSTMPGAKQKIETSGVKIQYQADFKFRVSHGTPLMDKDGKTQIGQGINWTCMNTPIGVKNKTGVGILMFETGIDEVAELVEIGTETGVIRSAGAWSYLGEEKFNGKAKLADYLRTNADAYLRLSTQVKELLS